MEDKKATLIEEIDNVLQFSRALPSTGHPFYTDFTGLRGEFKENRLYRAMNLKPPNLTYDYEINKSNRFRLFLAGMRGSGKSTELNKIIQEIDKPDALFCIKCSVDEELNMDHVEFMDVLICLLEKLVLKAEEKGVQLDKDAIRFLQNWFDERVTEINKSVSGYVAVEAGVMGEFGLPFLAKIFGSLRTGFKGSKEQADSIRRVFRHRFGEFAERFNTFVLLAADTLRQQNMGRDVLFIVDGLEKTNTAPVRRAIIIDNAESIKSIKANLLLTLPIELMSEVRKVKDYADVLPFPFVKIREQDGSFLPATLEKFKEFITRRIDTRLFESDAVIDRAARFSGGSPRELLRLLQHTGYELAPTDTRITLEALDSAIQYLSADAQYLNTEELEILRIIHRNNSEGKPTHDLDGLGELLEEIVVMEYNSGTYKRVNPIIAQSSIYKEYVDQDGDL